MTKTIQPLFMGMLLLLGLGLGRSGQGQQVPRLTALAPQANQITLVGPYARARLLVEGASQNGKQNDLSKQIVYRSLQPQIATVDEEGEVRAQQDGTATILVTFEQGKRRLQSRVQVTVQGVAKAGTPRFLTDVMPVLTGAGCNLGACHGANAGKGGFHLSLLGYDPEGDYEILTRFAKARRLSPADPDNSLLLRKAALTMKHGGGQRFRQDSVEYRILRDWIAGGTPRPTPQEPSVKRLEVWPAARTMALGQVQRLRVVAHYTDGTNRDVTALTHFSTGDGDLLSVSPRGEVKTLAPGAGAVVTRYQGVFATARLVMPFGPARPIPSLPADPIDRLVLQRVAALGLEPSARCTDDEFIRRATLDVTGLLPSPDAVRTFLADTRPDKRALLVESLLNSSEYVDYWTLKWSDFLRSSRRSLSVKGMYALNGWIRQQVQQNASWDRFATSLLLAQGSAFENGAVNYFRAGIEPESRTLAPPEDLSETTAQLFCGVRLQCARCHNHPFEKWKQQQFYQLAGFFGRLRTKPGGRQEEQVLFATDEGEVRHPKTGQPLLPAALDAPTLPATYTGDRRQALVRWLTAKENPFFARIIVNRLWKHYLGRGLVEPVDDLRETNPPTNEPLLNYLANDLREHGYDLKYLMRRILQSETYQRSSRRTPLNERDNRYYSRYFVKRLGAEPLLDALSSATGVAEKFAGFPQGTRALQLPDTEVASYFLDAFGRPPRNTTCECERSNEPNVTQALHLMNSVGLNAKLTAAQGRAALLAHSDKSPVQIVEELFLTCFARPPTPAESLRDATRIMQALHRQQAIEDLLWAMLNSREFLFNH